MSNPFERYERIQAAKSPRFDSDGRRLSFLRYTTNGQHLWVMDGSDAWPEQLTYGPWRVAFSSWSPETDTIIFGADRDGTERIQLYHLELAEDAAKLRAAGSRDDAPITKLTDEPRAIHRWGGWSSDGSRIAFSANRRSPRDFDIYVKPIHDSDNDARLVRKETGKTEVSGWSPNDEQLLVRRSESKLDQHLHFVSVETGDTTRITPETERVRFLSPQWGPDGEFVYCVTDYQNDRLYFARIDPDEQDILPLLQYEESNVESVAVSSESGHFVAYRNQDAYTDLISGTVSGAEEVERLPKPELPAGVGGGGAFDGDGSQFALPFVTCCETMNVYVVSMESGSIEQWTDVSMAGIPSTDFVDAELIQYESFDGLNVPGFFSLPPQTSKEGVPVVIDIHGGPRSQRRPGFNAFKQYLLHRGFAVFEPNIRGSSGYGKQYAALDDGRQRMDAVADVAEAVAWLNDHPVVDADRTAIMGASYGGFVTLSALYSYPDLFAAGISICGITDFTTFLENTSEWRRTRREREYGSLSDDREFLERISPLSNADQIAAPLLVVHGENDPRVPVSEAKQLIEVLRDAEVEVKSKILDDEGHGISKGENRVEVYNEIADFLEHNT
ncbi:S9 family peptidase [Halorussus amylolyticus]|uniref:S9 family peptidase n=1 Tax=Halorussus amylolyticus TaxID=1126242 RepID=UPI001045B876|nr:S9 family peptidase [Halorussus amylolyticus]